MPTVVVTKTVDEDELATLLTPRDDMVVEAETAPGRFEIADDGPFDSYARVIEHEANGDGGYDITQTVDFKLAIPIWAPLFNPLVKRTIRKPPVTDKPPWWLPPDRLDRRATRALSYLCAFEAMSVYFLALLSTTNPYFKLEFGATDGDISFLAATVRVGGLLAFVFTIIADRRGRKTVLVWTTYAAVFTTALGAFSPNLPWLAGSLTLSRACAVAMSVIIGIMAVEEMPRNSRAFAVSVTVMAGALGGAGVYLPLQLAELSPWAWRGFYLAPFVLLLVLPRLRVALPETKRFEVHEAHELHLDGTKNVVANAAGPASPGPARSDGFTDGSDLGQPAQRDEHERDSEQEESSRTRARRPHSVRRRFITLGVSAFLMAIFISPSSLYQNEWLKTEQGFVGWQITLFIVLTTIPGGPAIVGGGMLADRLGRRLIGSIGVAGGVGFTVLMFLSSGAGIWVFSAFATLLGALAVPALGVYGPELFGTGNRGKSNGALTVLGVAGSAIGYLLAGQLAVRWGGYSHAIPFLAIGPLIVVFIILLLYPETAHKELEELNPEDAPPPSNLHDLAELEHELDEAHEHKH